MEAEFLKLHNCLNNGEYKEAESIVNNITIAISEDGTNLDMDACIIHIFNEYTGLENFIKKAIFKKDFSSAVTKVFELLYTLTNNFFLKIKNYVLSLAKLSLYIVILPSTGSLVKNKFGELLGLIINRPEKVFTRNEIEDIYSQLYEKFKYKDRNSVLGKIVQILGVIAKCYPEVVREPEVLLQLVVSSVEYDCTKYEENIFILAAYFGYLSDFFESFSAPDDIHVRLYKCIKIAAENGRVSIKTAGRAALLLFGKHMSKYAQFLAEDSNFWNNTLRCWLSRSGDDQKVGFSAILSFNQELAIILRNRTDDEAKMLFEKFFNMFYDSLNVEFLHGYQLRLVIRGIGIYADAYCTHRSVDQLQNTFLSIVHRMETIYLTDIEKCKTNMDYLPDYLEISTAFLKQFQFVTSVQLICLERLTILLFRMFPNLSVAHHGLVVESLLLTLYRLKYCTNDLLDKFLQNVIYQAVIWACSHQIVADAEVLKLDSNQDIVTYKMYIPLWKNLLHVNTAFCKKNGIKTKHMIFIIESLYDELVKVLFVLINKLNLNIQQIEEDSAVYLPPELAMQAEEMNDFAIFVNVVDFYGDIFELASDNYFKKWITMFTNQIIDKSIKQPLISGFYKLLASCLIVCDKLSYFNEERLLKKDHVKIAFDSIKKHIEDTILRMAQYTGDLQLACLTLILVTPMVIINSIELNFAAIFIAAFNVGRSYLQITSLAIDTLEKWNKSWPDEKLEPFLMQVVPSLDSYLRSKTCVEHAEKPKMLMDSNKTKKQLKKRKMYVDSEPELFNIQKKILMFLSKLNSDLCYEFVNANVHTEPVMWSERSHLKLMLPFECGEGIIYLETFVPRVLDLALNSSDGKTKMAACEFLHSIIMVMLGTSAKMDVKRIEDLDKLLQKIIETIIKLACDYDNAIRQLFHLLLMQLMHWYSHPRQFKSAQTSIVLTALFDGTIDAVNSDIRNTSGIALHEFVKYTRKQTKECDLKKDPATIEAIIRTVTSYNVHPDAVKRFAGALIFNNIYTEIREESSIFNIYWVELFHSFVISLSLQRDIYFIPADNCVVEINKALDRLTRGFIDKHHVFRKHDNNRKTPAGFKRNSLADVAMFLFDYSAVINRNCRAKCLELFEKVAAKVKGSIKSFLNCEVPTENWLGKFEHELDVYTDLANNSAFATNDCLLKWFSLLVCSLDGLLFAVKNNSLPQCYDFTTSKTYEALKCYFGKVLTADFKHLCNEQSLPYEIHKKTNFDHFKYLVTTNIINLLITTAPLQQCNLYGFAFDLYNLEMYICNCLFNTEDLGFRANTDLDSKVVIKNLIHHLMKYLPTAKTREICKYIKNYIQETVASIGFKISSNVWYKQRKFVKGLLLLQTTDLAKYIQFDLPKILPILIEALFEEVQGQIITKQASASTTEYLKSLHLILIQNNETNDFINNLSNHQKIQIVGTHQTMHYGLYLANYFLSGLAVIIKIDKTYIELLMRTNCTNNNSISDFIALFINILKYMEKNKLEFSSGDIHDIVEMIMKNWHLLDHYLNQSSENTVSALQILQYTDSVNNHVVDWYLHSLVNKPKLIDEDSMMRLHNGLLPILYKAANFVEVNNRQDEFKTCLNNLKQIYYVNLKRPSLIDGVKIVTLKLLDGIAKTKSPTLIVFTVDLYIMFYKDTDTFLKYSEAFIVGLINNFEDDVLILPNLFRLCKSMDGDLQKTILAVNIFCSIISRVKIRYFDEFFLDSLEDIFNILETKECSKDIIRQKVMSFLLLETFFSRVNLNTFYTELYGTYTGKHILQIVLTIGLNIFKDACSNIDDVLENYYRKYFRYAYNALVTIISITQTNIDFFYKMVLREVDNKDVMWEKIVDITKTYTFSDRFDITPDRKIVVVKIKATTRELFAQTKTVKYIESQPLFGSTLCEDITKYDFTNSTVRSQIVIETNDKVRNNMSIVLENLEINDHECMPTLCGLFQHIISLEQEQTPNSSKFCQILKCLIENESIHSNIKIFIVKIIENMSNVFKPYCAIFFEPLTNCITSEIFGDNLNFFNTDVVIMLINWYDNTITIPPRQCLSNLYKFLITRLECENNNRDIFKYNMSIIKVFIEMWKTHFDLPYEDIMALLKVPVASKKVEVGIQVVAMLLSNDISPWIGSLNSIRELASALSGILANDHTAIYKSCAETIGMGIKSLAGQPDLQGKFITLAEKKLALIKKKDKLAYCIEAMMKHYPLISRNFLVDLLYDLDNVRGNFKYIYMRIFLNSIAILHNSRDLENVNFKNQLNESNIDVQIVSLEFIAKSVSYFSITQIAPIVEFIIDKFPNSSSATCRSIMYDICIAICEKYGDSESELVQLCMNCLLQGLIETEPEIDEKIRLFWGADNKMPGEIYSKFLYILKTMYSPDIEEYFLAYSLYFLLNSLKETEAYSESIFEYPLHECEYTDFVLKYHWRERHATIAPMFASTLQSHSIDYSIPSVTDFNMFRKTQSQFEFTPTQQNHKYLSKEKQRVLQTYESSLLFAENIAQDTNEFVNPNDVDISTGYKILNRRFLKDKSQVSRFIAIGQVKKNVKKDELRNELAIQREKQVTIYRKYRKGEYPDIQIPNSDLIAPLVVLCKYDGQIARQLFGKLFIDIISKQAPDNFSGIISEVIGTIFSRSTEYTKHVMGTFLDIAISYKDSMQFSSHIITKVCINSGLMSMGTLLLEEYLIQGVDTPPKVGTFTDTEISFWTNLATLYKELEETDIVRGIFFAKMNCKENVLEAFDAESQNEYKLAISLFTTIISEEFSTDKRDFYYESYFRCFAELSKWNDISTAISSSIEDSIDYKTIWTELWDKDFNQNKLLPWFIKAELHNIVKDDNRKIEFLGCINDTLQDLDRVHYLKYTFPEEMAFLWIFNNDPEKSLYYLNIFIVNFLNNWSGLNPLFTAIRRHLIIHQRNAMDIYVAIEKITNASVENFEQAINDITHSWEKTSLENVSSISLSERRNLYRTTLLTVLDQKADHIFSTQNEIKDNLKRTKFNLDLNLINCALNQENFHIAKTYIQDKNKYVRNKDSVEGKQSILAYSKILFLKAKMMPHPNQQISVFKDAWNSIAHVLADSESFEDDLLRLNYTRHIFKINQELCKVFETNADLFTRDLAITLQQLARVTNTFENYTDLKKFAINQLEDQLINSCKSTIENCNGHSKLMKDIANSYLNLAYFCMKSNELLEKETISYVLKAMYYESREGCQLFPCLLNLQCIEDDLNADLIEIFQSESSKIPTWMFIQWIPQLLANVDSKKIHLIFDIILRIAKTYPSAIMYPYRLSKEKYQFKDLAIKNDCEHLISKLDALLLNNSKIEKFLVSIASLTSPENLLLDYVHQLNKSLRNKYLFLNVSEAANSELFSANFSLRDSESSKGMLFKIMANFKADFLSLNNGTFDWPSIKLSLQKLYEKIKSVPRTKSVRLKDYSPWLHNFATFKDDFEIEIPGQYLGFKKPLPQYHIKIYGFSPEVKTYSSLREPIQMTILGNDSKEYPFLVKHGEDLRQDQRIEQLFNLMNDTLQCDSNCRQRKLSILTYQVIPLTSRLGIIQWVRATETLGNVLRDALPVKANKAFELARGKFQIWIEKCSKSTREKEQYRDLHLNRSRNDVIPFYRSLVNEIPWDLLRRAFWKRSTSPESYYVIRSSFITSYGTMCLAHWLLGIGDRHLENTKIAFGTGKVVGVDFGHAFGTATEVLAVPELVPIRLTPCIINLMQPLNEHGFLQETMIHTLRALRMNSDGLLATLDVFMREPSVDWLDCARQANLYDGIALSRCEDGKSSSDDGASAENDDHTLLAWYPIEKVARVRDKLVNGANPRCVTVQELQARGGRDEENLRERLVAIVNGDPITDLRARLKDSNLSVEEQVRSLLDQSTDFNLLGRMYVGWESWV